MAAHQAPPSLGFSRQEHWSGLPFPSPMYKVKSESEVAQSCLTLATPWTAAHQAPLSMGLSREKYWSGVPLPSPDVQAGFRKDRGIRDQIANIHWLIEKAREFQKNIHICFTDYTKAFDSMDHSKIWKIL